MATTFETQNFRINGVIDTGKNVWENLETIAGAAGCWVAFDIHTGKWSVIINRSGASVHSFNDSNIIGGINLSGTGLFDLYNSVSVSFPNKEIYDLKDVSIYEIPVNERNPGELDNTLNLNFDIVNDVIHAQILALTELHQSRVDKIIEFRTDYSKLALKAGDIIDITNEALGFTNKKFRIISITEEDGDDNTIILAIRALEYSDSVYDYSRLNRFIRQPNNQLIQRKNNDVIQELDDQDISRAMNAMLLANVTTGLLNLLFDRDPITKKLRISLVPKDADRDNLLSSFQPCAQITGPSSVCEGSTISLSLNVQAFSSCSTGSQSYGSYPYTITGVSAADISPFPLTGTVQIPSTVNIPVVADGLTEPSETLVFTVNGASKSVVINSRLGFTYSTTASSTSITEGQSSTVTLTTTGIANGTSINYSITGSATDRVTTPLSGSVTINNNQATLVINTVNDSIYTGTQSITVTFNSSTDDPCGQLDNTVSISILDNDPPTSSCNPITVPVFWCPVYDGATGQVIRLDVLEYASFCSPISGQSTATVPLTVSVTKGNPSTVTITSTATVDASRTSGGRQYTVFTSFNSIPPNGGVTGTSRTLVGF